MIQRKQCAWPRCLHPKCPRRPAAMSSYGVPHSALRDHLNDGLLATNFQHLTTAHSAIRQGKLDNLIVGREL